MSLEEMLQTMFDRSFDKIPVRLSIVSQIKNEVLEAQFRLYNISLELCNTYTRKYKKELKDEEKALYDELCFRMQDLEDVLYREVFDIDKLNYKYEDPTEIIDPQKIADEKYPIHPWKIMPKEDDNGRIINFDEWLDDYRIWVQSWNLNFGFVKGWEYAIGKSVAGKKVSNDDELDNERVDSPSTETKA